MRALICVVVIGFATPALADQRDAVMWMIHDRNHIGAAVPTGIDVDAPTYKTDVTEFGYFRTYNHNDPCWARRHYVCQLGQSRGGPEGGDGGSGSQ